MASRVREQGIVHDEGAALPGGELRARWRRCTEINGAAEGHSKTGVF